MNTKNLYAMESYAPLHVREPDDDDEDADLATANRGDNFDPVAHGGEKPDTSAEDAKAVTTQLRGEDGKFIKAGDDKGDDDKGDDDKDEAKDAAASDDDEEDDKDDDDKQNFPIRLNKAHEQRDAARAAAAEAEARARAAEERLAALEPKPAAKKEDPIAKINTELDELYVKAEELRQAGDVAEAAKVQRQIDTKNREIGRIEAAAVAGAASTAAQINARYDAMLDVAEANIPALDPSHDDYDKKAVKKLEFHVEAYEKMGMRGDEALKEAIALLHPDHAALFDKTKKPAAKAPDAKPPVQQRKPDAGKAVDTANRQPPDGAGKGASKDNTKISAATISEEDFDAIPASKLKEMRGDQRA